MARRDTIRKRCCLQNNTRRRRRRRRTRQRNKGGVKKKLSIGQWITNKLSFTHDKRINVEASKNIIETAKQKIVDKYKNNSIVHEITVPKNGKLHVIGDIVGDQDALNSYLNQIGVLNNSNQVLFLGNIIGRDIECSLKVLQYFIKYPDYCTILRGIYELQSVSPLFSHEDISSESGQTEQQNIVNPRSILNDIIKEIFDYLPLCSTINNSIFACHSGPPFTVTMESTSTEETHVKQYTPIPVNDLKQITLPNNVDGDSNVNSTENQLLWNRPFKQTKQMSEQSSSQVPQLTKQLTCYKFDNTALTQWLQKSDITRVLRTHHYKKNKTEKAITAEFEDKSLLTIFSCPTKFEQAAGGYLQISFTDTIDKPFEYTHVHSN